MNKTTCLALILSFFAFLGNAALVIDMSKPKSTGQKTMIKLDMKNTFSEKIEGAKGTIFLMDDNGKVTGQASRWIIGGTKNRPPLATEDKVSYYFVVSSDKPFTKIRLMLDRVILEDGKLADATKDVIVKETMSK